VRLSIGERPHEVVITPDLKVALVSQFGIADYDNRIGTLGDRIVQVDLKTGVASGAFVLPEEVRGPHGVKLRPLDYCELFIIAEVGGGTMPVFDVATHRLLRRHSLPEVTHEFMFSSDGAAIHGFGGGKDASKLAASPSSRATGRQHGSWQPARRRYSRASVRMAKAMLPTSRATTSAYSMSRATRCAILSA